jgi:hypothetical protein
MSDERPYPKKDDTLFEGDIDIYLNADISHWNKDLSGYAKGYKAAADFIVSGAIEGHRSYDFHVSYIVFPVVFLYRQYIELRLKEIILLGTRINCDEHGFPKHHRIDELWKHARPYIEKYCTHEQLSALGVCINEFCSFDSDGLAFRYPVDKEGKPHLPEWTVVNIRHLGETMQRIGNLLDDAADVLYMELQHVNEIHGEY